MFVIEKGFHVMPNNYKYVYYLPQTYICTNVVKIKSSIEEVSSYKILSFFFIPLDYNAFDFISF